MDLEAGVISVLKGAMHGKNEKPGWVTAYQVVNRLPKDIRAELLSKHDGAGGRKNGAERGTGAANAVMRIMLNHPDVQISYFDAWHDTKFYVEIDDEGDHWVQPGNDTCAVYRWRQPDDPKRV